MKKEVEIAIHSEIVIECNVSGSARDHIQISTTFSDNCSNIGVGSVGRLVWFYNRSASWNDMNFNILISTGHSV